MKMNKILKSLLITIVLITGMEVKAVHIEDPNSFLNITYSEPEDMTLCGDPSTYTVDVRNVSNEDVTGLAIDFLLPVGISYVSMQTGIVDFTNYLGGKTPSFRLEKTLQPGDEIQLVFYAKSSCETYSDIDAESGVVEIRDEINIRYVAKGSINSFSAQGNSYNVTFSEPVLTIPIKVNSKDNIKQSFNSKLSIIEQFVDLELSGNSNDIKKFNLVIDVPKKLHSTNSKFVCELKRQHPNPITLDPNGITETLLIDGRVLLEFDVSKFSNISEFKSSDEYRLKFCYTVNDCALNEPLRVDYRGAIICDGDVCNLNKVQGSFGQEPLGGTLSSSISSTNDPNLCGKSERITYTLANKSNHPVYDISFSADLDVSLATGSNFKIDGVSSPELNTESKISPSSISLKLENVKKLGDPVLSDVNNDGRFTELAPGESIDISFDLEFLYEDSKECGRDVYSTYFSLESAYNGHECQNPKKTKALSRDFYFWNHTAEVSGEPDLSDGEVQIYKFCTSLIYGETYDDSHRRLWNDRIYFLADLELPCGFLPATNPETNPTVDITVDSYGPTSHSDKPLTYSKIGDKFRYKSKSNFFITAEYGSKLKACFYIPIELDCDKGCNRGSAELSFKSGLEFNECSNEMLTMDCETKDVVPHCDFDGSVCETSSVVMNNSFEATRMTFGFKDDNRVNKYTLKDVRDGNTPDDLKLDAAYSCDEILIEFDGTLYCAAMNSLEASFSYSVPDFGDFLTTQSAKFWVNGSEVSVNTLPVSPPSAGMATHSFISYTPVNPNDVFRAEIIVKVNSTINFTTDFPDVHDLDPFRGGFTAGTNSALEDWGTEFQIYSFDKISHKVVDLRTDCGRSPVLQQLLLVSGGTDGDDFPSEIRPVAKFNNYSAKIVDLTHLQNLGVSTGAANNLVSLTEPDGNSTNLTSHISPNGDLTVSGLGNFRAEDKTKKALRWNIVLDFDATNCRVSSTKSFLKSNFSLDFGLYSEDLSCHQIIESVKDVESKITKPNKLVYEPVFTFQQALSNVVTFDGKLTADVNNDTEYPWIAIEFDGNYINVQNAAINGFKLSAGQSEILRSDGNAIFIPLNLLPKGKEIQGAFEVIINNCNTERTSDITVTTGFSCSKFDGNPWLNDGTVKYCSLDKDKVTIGLLKSGVSLDIFKSYDEAVDFCAPICYLTQSFNAEKADLGSPNLDIELPLGMSIYSFKYYHPLQIGEIIDQKTFNYSTYNFGAFTTGTNSEVGAGPWYLKDDGVVVPKLPGSASDDIDNNSETLNNYYLAEVCVLPSCNYDLGNDIVFKSVGKNTCQNDLIAKKNVRPIFKGAEELESYMPIVETSYKRLPGCNDFEVTIKWTSNINIEKWSSAGDKIMIYKNGNQLYGESFKLPRLEGGFEEYTFKTKGLVCNDINLEFISTLKVDVQCQNSQVCNQAPYSKKVPLLIPFEKGNLNLEIDLHDNACELTTGNNVEIILKNDGPRDMVGVSVQFYCDKNNDGKFSIFDDPILLSDNQINYMTYSIPSGTTLKVETFIHNISSCGSGSIIGVVDQTNNCNCQGPSIAFDNFVCCDASSVNLVGDIDCKAFLPLDVQGYWPIGSVGKIEWDADNNGFVTNDITDFTNLSYAYDKTVAATRKIKISIVTPYCGTITDEHVVTFAPKEIRINPKPDYCDATVVDLNAYIQGEGPSTGFHHTWTVDGVILNENTVNVSHDFINYDSKLVELYAEDADGCSYTDALTTAPTTDEPAIIIQKTKISCGVYKFDIVSDDAPAKIRWDFGDGVIVSNGATTENHTYLNTNNQSYLVKVTADTRGVNACTVEDDITVDVDCCVCDPDMEVVGTLVSYNSQTEAYVVDMKTNSKGTIQNYYYTTEKDVNNNPINWKIAKDPNAIEVFCASEICLKIGNSCGVPKAFNDVCNDFTCISLTHSCPVVELSLNDFTFCPGESVIATLTVTGGPLDFSAWSLNGGVATIVNSDPHTMSYSLSDEKLGDNSICVSYESDIPMCQENYGIKTIDFSVKKCGIQSDCTEPQYTSRTLYNQNDLIKNNGDVYKCVNPNLCGASSIYYEPGVGSMWVNAWVYEKECNAGNNSDCIEPKYFFGNSYNYGEKVQNDGKIYECHVPGWCGGSQAHYEPGLGSNWDDAWDYIQNCGDQNETNCTEPEFVTGDPYSKGQIVKNNGALYECKEPGWCTIGGWAYAPGSGSYWRDAWDFVNSCDVIKGIVDNENEGIILSVYPTPASGKVTVKLTGGQEFRGGVMRNDIGKVVRSNISSTNGFVDLDVSNFGSGVYFLEVINQGDLYIQKIIVVH